VLEFAIISLLLVLSPGPNGALILKTCLNKGSKHSFVNIFGLVSATFLHGGFSIFGLSAIIKNIPSVFLTIQILGSLYLCYIGIKAIISAIKANKVVENDDDFDTKPKTLFFSFIEGFLTQILNPKVSMFYLAAFPLFIDFDSVNYISTSFTLVVIHASFIFAWFAIFTLSFNKIKALFNGSKTITKYLQIFTGGVLIYFGLLILKQL
jgi:threonine/homoserine/homoserine lactone efflux protein